MDTCEITIQHVQLRQDQLRRRLRLHTRRYASQVASIDWRRRCSTTTTTSATTYIDSTPTTPAHPPAHLPPTQAQRPPSPCAAAAQPDREAQQAAYDEALAQAKQYGFNIEEHDPDQPKLIEYVYSPEDIDWSKPHEQISPDCGANRTLRSRKQNFDTCDKSSPNCLKKLGRTW